MNMKKIFFAIMRGNLNIMNNVKMLRNQKHFGRCKIEGHGGYCIFSSEIQSKAITRTREKKMYQSEIKDGLDEYYLLKNEDIYEL